MGSFCSGVSLCGCSAGTHTAPPGADPGGRVLFQGAAGLREHRGRVPKAAAGATGGSGSTGEVYLQGKSGPWLVSFGDATLGRHGGVARHFSSLSLSLARAPGLAPANHSAAESCRYLSAARPRDFSFEIFAASVRDIRFNRRVLLFFLVGLKTTVGRVILCLLPRSARRGGGGEKGGKGRRFQSVPTPAGRVQMLMRLMLGGFYCLARSGCFSAFLSAVCTAFVMRGFSS